MAKGPLVLRTNSQDSLKYKDLLPYVTSAVLGWDWSISEANGIDC